MAYVQLSKRGVGVAPGNDGGGELSRLAENPERCLLSLIRDLDQSRLRGSGLAEA